MSDVYFYEAFEEECAQLQALCPPGIRAAFTPATIQEAGHTRPPCPLISIRTQSVIPGPWAESLSGILSRSSGHDHLLAYLGRAPVPVPCGYLPEYCVRAVAEQAVILWMALLRRLPRQTAQFETFHRDGITGQETLDKTLAVVGVGHIGHEIAAIGQSLGMHVVGVDLARRHEDIDYASPEEAMSRSDVVVCAMNLTGENAGYFGFERFRACAKPVVFVNVARGELSPATGLLRALDAGLLAGVGLDVFNQESDLAVTLRSGNAPDAPDLQALMELKRRPNVIFTPHNAFNTTEAVRRKSEQSWEQIAAFLRTGRFRWSVAV